MVAALGLLGLGAAAPACAQSLHVVEVGAHLASWHSNRTACASRWLKKCQQANPGLWVETAGGWVFGGYANSLERTTYYAGRSFWRAERGRFSVELVGVLATGYDAAPIVPLVTPVGRVEIGRGYGLTVGYLPRIGKANPTHVFHFGISRRLP